MLEIDIIKIQDKYFGVSNGSNTAATHTAYYSTDTSRKLSFMCIRYKLLNDFFAKGVRVRHFGHTTKTWKLTLTSWLDHE